MSSINEQLQALTAKVDGLSTLLQQVVQQLTSVVAFVNTQGANIAPLSVHLN